VLAWRGVTVGSHASTAVEFVLVVEAGPLEAQAVLLVESLRRFGGQHAEQTVTAVSPRRALRPARSTVRELQRLGAEFIPLDVEGACPDYPTTWRVHAVAHAERRPGPAIIAQLDSDTLFLGDIGPLCETHPVNARPVDVKGMGSTGPGDFYEPYWEALCGLAGVPLEALPFVTATVDGARVRATHNGGFVAARRELGLFSAAESLFRQSVRAGLRPHAGTGLNVTAGAGNVGLAGSEWWGSGQAIVSVAAAKLGCEIGPLPLDVNVPMHSWAALAPKPSRVAHAHYHWLLGPPGPAMPDPNPMVDPVVVGSGEAAAWLRARVPLRLDPAPQSPWQRWRRR
jgi:hypothetical protein